MVYEAIGAIRFGGCAIKKFKKNYLTYFNVGSRAWIKQKAKMGVIESVVLKKVYRTVPENYKYSGIAPAITYVDTFNRVWIEQELTWEEDAIDLAKLHWERIKRSAEEYILTKCPTEQDVDCGNNIRC